MRPDLNEEYESQSMAGKSINDSLFRETKAAGGGLPFPGSGGFGGGMVPVYSSWSSWDASVDMQFGGARGRSMQEYANKIGDLASHSLLVAAIRWLGNAIQEAPITVQEKTPDGEGESESDAVRDHPLANLWENPNDHYSGATLKKAIAFSWILSSNAYIIKNYGKYGGEPLELWWEPHWTIRPVWPVDGSKFIAYYEVNRNGTWLKVPVENVIHLRDGLSPYNQRLGFSAVPSVLPELYGDGEAAAYYATLMGGSAVPPFMVALDHNMRIDQKGIDAFTQDLINKTTGRRRGQPIVAKGAKAYKLGWSPKELDFRESRYMAEDRFCAVMGIPAVVLELGTGMAHSIYNNVKQAEERAWKSYVIPMLNQIAKELTVQLLDDWEEKGNGRFCEHNTSRVEALQEEAKAKAERWTGLYEKGVATRKEARSALNLGPSDPKNPDADNVFFVQAATEKAAMDQQAAEAQAERDKALEEERQKQLDKSAAEAGARALGVGSEPSQNRAIVKALLEQPQHKHTFSSVMALLPIDQAVKVMEVGRMIPANELHTNGIENRPHVTVLYGLHTDNFEEVARVLENEPPVTIKFGDIFIFPAEGEREYDVLNFRVESPDLTRINKLLRESLDNTVQFSFKAHACIAYLKAGEGEKYIGLENKLTGTEITLDRLTFSSVDGLKVEIPLSGEVKS